VIWIFAENFVHKLVGRGRVSAIESPLGKLKQPSGLVSPTLNKMLAPFRHVRLLAGLGDGQHCICGHEQNLPPGGSRHHPFSRLAGLVPKAQFVTLVRQFIELLFEGGVNVSAIWWGGGKRFASRTTDEDSGCTQQRSSRCHRWQLSHLQPCRHIPSS